MLCSEVIDENGLDYRGGRGVCERGWLSLTSLLGRFRRKYCPQCRIFPEIGRINSLQMFNLTR